MLTKLILKIIEHVLPIHSSNMYSKMRGRNESTPPTSPLISLLSDCHTVSSSVSCQLMFEDITEV
jgi:hypothetical protein